MSSLTKQIQAPHIHIVLSVGLSGETHRDRLGNVKRELTHKENWIKKLSGQKLAPSMEQVLNAYLKDCKAHRDELRELEAGRYTPECFWSVNLSVGGPDGRYNPGYANFRKDNIENVNKLLALTIETMSKGEAIPLDLGFKKQMGQVENLIAGIEKKQHVAEMWADIGLYSGTNWIFRRFSLLELKAFYVSLSNLAPEIESLRKACLILRTEPTK